MALKSCKKSNKKNHGNIDCIITLEGDNPVYYKNIHEYKRGN